MVGARWQAGQVVFGSEADYVAHFQQFLSKGAVLVTGDGLPPPLEPFDFALVPPGAAPVRLRGMIVSTTPAGALVQILDFSSALASTLGARPPPPGPAQPAAPTPTPAPAPARAPRTEPPRASALHANRAALLGLPAAGVPPPADSVPLGTDFAPDTHSTPRAATGVFPMAPMPSGVIDGAIVNPQTLRELTTLPLGPVAAVPSLATVSLIGLIRYLGARRATGQLHLSGPAERHWVIERGAIQLTAHEREAARAAFTWPTAKWRFEPRLSEQAPNRVAVSAWRLVLDALRARLREATLDELRAEIDLGRAVSLRAAYLERSRSLDLSPQEERLVKRDLDGRNSLAQVVKLGAISELGLLRLVYLLQLVGVIDYAAAEGEAAREDEVREHYERLVSSDLFTALGLHWTDAPERLDAGLADVWRIYGPGSAAHGSSPEYAAKVVELAERAHRRLKDKGERRRYREELQLNVRHAAELLVAQVPLAKARNELRRAWELMCAVCDLYDKPEWERLRRELQPVRSD